MTLTNDNTNTMTPLSAIEARVLGTLMEKARTVPDSYPLSLNSLLLGCNQKTSRDPVMELDEASVIAALATLTERQLVRENTGGRVPRFEHNFQRGMAVPEQSAVLLGLLMLRGPQTAAELRLNAERWYKFADTSSVEAFLDELQNRAAEKGGALVQKLERTPGARESRWAQLLCGPVSVTALQSSWSAEGVSLLGSSAVKRIACLESQVAALTQTVQQLCAELGIEPTAGEGASGAPHLDEQGSD